MIQNVQKCKNDTSGEKTEISEVKKLHLLKCKNYSSRGEEITPQEVKKIQPNNNTFPNYSRIVTDHSNYYKIVIL